MKKSLEKGKRMLSLLLAIVLVIAGMPLQVHAAEENAISENDIQMTAYSNPEEDPDFEGYATLAVEKFTTGAEDYIYEVAQVPIINKKTYTPELLLNYLYGEGTFKGMRDEDAEDYFSYKTKAIKDASETGGSLEGYLSNGDYGENSQWFMTINNVKHVDPTQVQKSRIYPGNVIRFMYSVDGGSDIGLSGNELAVNKDELLTLLSQITTEDLQPAMPGNPIFDAYLAAKDVARSLTVSQAQVNDAYTKLYKIWNGEALYPAESITLTPDTSVQLAEEQTQDFEAAVVPSYSTDHVDWVIEDPSIARLDIKTQEENGPGRASVTGITEGTTTLTATAGSQSVSCQIIVKKVPAESITLTPERAQVMLTKSLNLKAKVLPELTTDKLEWSVEDPKIASVDQKGTVTPIALGKTNVIATAGKVSASCEVEVIPYDGPYVYFEYKDGRKQEMNPDDNSFTLSAFDEGTFKVGKLEGNAKLNWDCQARVHFPDDTYSEHYYIAGDGKFVPHDIGTFSASVSSSGKLIQNFKIHAVSSKITELKTFVGDQEVSVNNPYVTSGTSKAYVRVEGKVGNEWKKVPLQAVALEGSSNYGRIEANGAFSVNQNAVMTFDVVLNENYDIKTSFTATSKDVKLESFKVNVPEKFAIDSWNGIFADDFNGIQPYTGYTMEFTPSYASNKELIWESLTPEVAEYVEIHSSGIVPKKAGIAKFKVKSADNPEIPAQEIQVEFYYKDPLTQATVKDPEITMEEYSTRNLNYTTVPGNATEKRFHWSYSEPGIVEVNSIVRNDPNDVAIPKITSHVIRAIKPGTVTVTGTPYDTTGNCNDISFTVKVTSAEGEVTADYLQMAKDGIAHGHKYLKNRVETNEKIGYGDEWEIFAALRSGATLDQAKLDAYYADVEKSAKTIVKKRNTDIARVIITLAAMDKDPANVGGVNLYDGILNSKSATAGDTSNAYIWGLIGLDAFDYQNIPADAKWTREKLIDKILSFQTKDGGFGLGDNKNSGVDMTGMAVQALAPYYNDEHPEVKEACDKAVEYFKGIITLDGGFINEGDSNGCSVAQVITALTALGMDPTKEEGFTFGPKNMITNALSFKDPDGGYGTYLGNLKADGFASVQITYGLEAYVRLVEGKNRLYDMTDMPGYKPTEKPEKPEKPAEGWGKDGNYDIYTKADGTKATAEFLKIDGKIYYFDAASHKYATPGFKALNTIWYYFNQDGSLVTGWKSVGSVWYYFNNKGEMQKGWQQIDGYWYFFNGSGAMVKGWLKDGNNWFYFNGSGHMMTGWQAIGGKWYYFYNSGRMLTGWQKIDGHWYYLKSSGEMTKGWLKDGGKWFYFNGSGHMMTGWQAVSGKWYYFFDSGRMATGWLQEGGHWYYLKSSGEMTKGWLKDGSNWFYFNGSGHMLTGKQKIDGKWYTFRASGAMER